MPHHYSSMVLPAHWRSLSAEWLHSLWCEVKLAIFHLPPSTSIVPAWNDDLIERVVPAMLVQLCGQSRWGVRRARTSLCIVNISCSKETTRWMIVKAVYFVNVTASIQDWVPTAELSGWYSHCYLPTWQSTSLAKRWKASMIITRDLSA